VWNKCNKNFSVGINVIMTREKKEKIMLHPPTRLEPVTFNNLDL